MHLVRTTRRPHVSAGFVLSTGRRRDRLGFIAGRAYVEAACACGYFLKNFAAILLAPRPTCGTSRLGELRYAVQNEVDTFEVDIVK